MNLNDVQFLKTKLGSTLFHVVEEKTRIHGVDLALVRDRKSKLGDYRYNFRTKKHKITINKGLDKEVFFLTFLHEMAHLVNHDLNGFSVSPHGQEWKWEFKKLLHEAINLDCDEKTRKVLTENFHAPKATTRAKKETLEGQLNQLKVKDLKIGDQFNLISSKKSFSLGKKRRTRYDCIEIDSGTQYSVHGEAVVKRLDP